MPFGDRNLVDVNVIPFENILLQRKVGGDVGFPMVLQAGLRHFSKQLGFMFHQGFINGETAFSAALLLFQ